MRPGASLAELAVSTALAGLMLILGIGMWLGGERARARLERQGDEVRDLIGSVHAIRIELGQARDIYFPRRRPRADAVRPYLIYWDYDGRLAVMGLAGGALVVERLDPLDPSPRRPEVIARGVEALVFDHRRDIGAVRYQVFFPHTTLVGTVRPANELKKASFEIGGGHGR